MKKIIFLFLTSIFLIPSRVFACSEHMIHGSSIDITSVITVVAGLLILLSLCLFRFRKILHSFITFLFLLFILQGPISSTFAAGETVSVTSPNGGECLKGGSSTTVNWTQSGNDHFALYFRTDGGTPNYSGDSSGLFAHPVSGTSSQWSVPNSTSSSGRIWVEGHNSGHTPLVIDSSNSNFSIDASPPSAVDLSSSGKTASSVALAWSGSSDAGCKGLMGYKIFRNNTEITSVDANTTSYNDSGLTSATSYSYKIQAYDDFANTDSNSISVTTNSASSSNNGSSSSTTSTNTSNKATTTSSPTSKTTSASTSPIASGDKTTNAELKLEKIEIDGQLVNLNSDDTAVIAQGQSIALSGSATPNNVVVITLFSDPQVFETQTDANGAWNYILDTTELAIGQHRVEAALKDSSGAILPSRVLLQFNLIDVESDNASLTSSQARRGNRLWLLLSGIGFVIVVAAIIIFVKKRKKKFSPATTAENIT